jgi:hypothetical protein
MGIRINVVYFSVFGAEAELKKAQAQFEKPLERLDPPGKFVPAANLGQLILSLSKGIQQKLVCQIARADGTPLDGEPLDVTNPDEDLMRWWSSGLEPGTYKLRVSADRTYSQEVDLQKGDRLIVQLAEAPGGGIAFEHALYGNESDFRDKTRQDRPDNDWLLTVLTNQQVQQNSVDRLRLLVALESKVSSSPLRQIKPALVGFHLGAPDLRNPESVIALRWRERMLFPAPLWQLDVSQWPADSAGGGLAQPILQAWWWDSDRPLPAAGEFERDESSGPQTVRVDENQAVSIEDVRLEKHLVEVHPGEALQSRSCLVIRLAYPRESPYLIDPEPLKKVDTAGHEHRFYSQAGRYTGLFWPVNQSQFETIKRFKLVSLNRLQKEAVKRKNRAEIKLAKPRIDDKPPEPPQAIFK